jgi:CBS domain containing-hemolysin-like protein
VPKGYLYAAIGFALLIEMFNQVAQRNMLRQAARRPLRERTAEGVLRMLGKRPPDGEDAGEPRAQQPAAPAFGVEERNMVSGVLTLAERGAGSIMTPRTDISWIDIDETPEEIRARIAAAPHSFFPVCRGSLDEILGIGRAREMIGDLLTDGHINRARLREPIVVQESLGILRLMETLKRSRGQLVLVADEFGAIEGLVTPIDVLEAIAGEFPDEDETPDIAPESENVWRIDGAADLHHVEQVLETDDLIDESKESSTLAGYLRARVGHVPQPGDVCEHEGFYARLRFEVLHLDGRRIASVRVEKFPIEPEDSGAPATE